LETFKSYETKPASSIQEKSDTDYVGRLTTVLTSLRGVNRTDAFTLGSRFGSLADIMMGSKEQFSGCPGVGPVKGQRLWDAFNEPFKKTLGGEVGRGGSQVAEQQQPSGASGDGRRKGQNLAEDEEVEDIEEVDISENMDVGENVDAAGRELRKREGASARRDVIPASDDERDDEADGGEGDQVLLESEGVFHGDVLGPGAGNYGEGGTQEPGDMIQLSVPMEDEFLEEDDYEEF
jgi:hypothetical protein